MERFAAILHSADVTTDAEYSFFIDAEKAGDVGAESFSIELRCEFALRLRNEEISNEREAGRAPLPGGRATTLCFSRRADERYRDKRRKYRRTDQTHNFSSVVTARAEGTLRAGQLVTPISRYDKALREFQPVGVTSA
jgi:hypothetical protein